MSLLFEEISLSPKLEVDIRNQRPRLRRNRLILVEKAGGISLGVPINLINPKYVELENIQILLENKLLSINDR